MKKIYSIFILIICVLLAVCLSACFGSKDSTDKDTLITKYKIYPGDVEGKTSGNYVEYNVGEDLTIPFTVEGYIFYGYYTMQNGKGTKITDETGKVLADIDFTGISDAFAVFPYVEGKKINITFLNDDGTILETKENVDVTKGVTAPTATKPGYSFVGWSDKQNSSTGSFSLSLKKYSNDVTFYPVFKPATYRVSCNYYYKDSGMIDRYGHFESYEVTYQSSFKFKYKEIDGYNFAGYYTEEDGQGIQLTDEYGSSVVLWSTIPDNDTNAINVYGKYIEAPMYTLTCPNNVIYGFTVTYADFEERNGEYIDKEVYYSNGSTVENLRAKRSGYAFEGWYEDRTLYYAFDFATSSTITEDITLYPKFTNLETYKNQEDLYGYKFMGALSEINGSHNLNMIGNYQSMGTTPDSYYADFTGTITVHCYVYPVSGTSKGAYIKIGSNDYVKLERGESRDIEVDVTKGNLLYINGYSEQLSENTRLVYEITAGLPEYESNVTIETPEYIFFRVTKGNSYKLTVYPQSGYTFKGYSLTNNTNSLITDAEGKSKNVWAYDTDMTIYAIYIKNN